MEEEIFLTTTFSNADTGAPLLNNCLSTNTIFTLIKGGVGVTVGEKVAVGVNEFVAVGVLVAVDVDVNVGAFVEVADGVNVGEDVNDGVMDGVNV